MYIKDYYSLLDGASLIDCASEGVSDSNDIIDALEYHTSLVRANTLFICKGKEFKQQYVEAAVKSGATLIVSQYKYDFFGVPYIIVTDVRKAMALLAQYHYAEPQKKLYSVGITGTKGKTTAAYCYKTIVDEYNAYNSKMPTAIFSSVCNYYGGELEESHLTTPESPDLYKYMAHAVGCGIEDLVMEASSQGLKYNRLDGVEFDVGVFLNIAEDHISPLEHSDFNDYFSAKKRIAQISRVLVVNKDAPEHREVVKNFRGEIYTFSTQDDNADYYGYHITSERFGTSFWVNSKGFNRKFTIAMKGDFNVSNAISAIAAADIKGVPSHIIERGLAKAHVDGRMDWVSSKDSRINAVIDFAHNKLSFETLFDYLKKEYPEKDIVVVFGCSGAKAYDRRKVLPEISARYCSHMFITTMNTGPESFDQITAEIVQNIPEGAAYTVIEDRATAIRMALERFGESSIIVVAGRGRKKTHRTATGYEPYISDYDCVLEYVNEYDERKK